jgi:hypothetical protein
MSIASARWDPPASCVLAFPVAANIAFLNSNHGMRFRMPRASTKLHLTLAEAPPKALE